MIAIVANRNINSKGGSARVCLRIIKVLRDDGFKVKLLTKTPVESEEIEKWNGQPLNVDEIRSIEPFKFGAFGRYQKFLSYLNLLNWKADIFVNTSGDFLPFLYHPQARNIIYCHYPVVRLLFPDTFPSKYRRGVWKAYFETYAIALNTLIRMAKENSLFLTNSNFSRSAVKSYLGINATVVYPPVDIKLFKSLGSSKKIDRVITIARFNTSKNLEFALETAAKLPEYIEWDLVGSLDKSNSDYFFSLQEKARNLGINRRIHFHPNASLESLQDLLAHAKIYFHPTRGEHFGIAIVEAMAAGLVPLVWDYGGCSEIVPSEWQFSSAKDASEKIIKALDLQERAELKMMQISERFAPEIFDQSMTDIISKTVGEQP